MAWQECQPTHKLKEREGKSWIEEEKAHAQAKTQPKE